MLKRRYMQSSLKNYHCTQEYLIVLFFFLQKCERHDDQSSHFQRLWQKLHQESEAEPRRLHSGRLPVGLSQVLGRFMALSVTLPLSASFILLFPIHRQISSSSVTHYCFQFFYVSHEKGRTS